MLTHDIPEGVGSDWILGSQWTAAEDDEDQNEVGEDVMVDQSVTSHADTTDRDGEKLSDVQSCSGKPPLVKQIAVAPTKPGPWRISSWSDFVPGLSVVAPVA